MAELRYAIPDALAELSGGNFRDSAWSAFDYEDGTDALLLFLDAKDREPALISMLALVRTSRVLGNSLDRATVWVRSGEAWIPVYPSGHSAPLDVEPW